MENIIITDEPVTVEKFYICPIFELNEEVKLSGARWCSNFKSWYVVERNELYELYKRRYLLNNYDNIDIYQWQRQLEVTMKNGETERWLAHLLGMLNCK